jgi:hypothetical protein
MGQTTPRSVDSGAVYSVVPATLLRKLGIRQLKRTFTLADGAEMSRKIGDLLFRPDGRQRPYQSLSAKAGHLRSLDPVSREALGMMLDSVKRELRRLPML